MKKGDHKTVYRKDYRPSPFLVESISLHIDLQDTHTDVTATSSILRNPVCEQPVTQLFLHGEELELRSIRLNDRELAAKEYHVDDKGLTMQLLEEMATLEIVTRIYPDNNTALEGLYRSSSNYCTQCEAEGFRKITFAIDRPDVLSRYTTRIEGDLKTCPVLLANGNKIEEGPLENGRHYAVWHDPFPKPSYLFALVAGDLHAVEGTFVTGSGRSVDLKIYVEERNLAKCDHAMRSLKKAMRWDEQVYGLEYDLDIYMIVAVDDFNMGAMENKGLNIFNSKYVLASPESATDNDYLGIEGVVAHEYFHNWTGNRVTCRDWFQLSLKEGLTVFRDQEFSADMNSRPVQRVDDVRILRTGQFREDSGPMAHPVRPDSYVEINNFYTTTVYNKGAEVIRMMHTLLGPEGFRQGMDLYFARHDGQAVTCDDFVSAMEDANGYDLNQFRLWYSQSGTPILEVSEQFDPENEEYSITIRQSCPPTPGQETKQPFHMPVAIGLLDEQGNDIRISDDATMILELREAEETYVFSGVDHKPTLSFLRDFSAPVRITPFQQREDLAFLMARDSNLYNCCEAAFQLATEIVFEVMEALRQGHQPILDPLYIEAVAASITGRADDRALLAQALQLPSEMYLAGLMEVIDPDNLHAARRFVQTELATRLTDAFVRLYGDSDEQGDYQLTAESMGKRSLKNVALDYLMAIEQPPQEVVDRCLGQYERGRNMTDVISALQRIANSELDVRDEILLDFHQQWQHDPLVLDKWFILQATSRRSQTLAEVTRLLDHPSFSIKNPNKVRSLIGAFGTNHVRFHDRSGAGYLFLADRILELNSLNPQIAARLVSPFTTWKKYDGERQLLMRDQLERIISCETLSGDVYEIVKKSL